MRPALLLAVFFLACACAGPKRAAPYLHRDVGTGGPGARGVRVTYLGTNGYLLQSRGATLLVDPYFTRLSLPRVALQLRAESNAATVRWALAKAHAPRKVDGILVTHGHFDHLLDAPEVSRQTGARLIASVAAVSVANAAGLSAHTTRPVRWNDSLRVGSAKVTVLPAEHDRILGRVPFPGEPSGHAPRLVSDYVCGLPLAFLIEMGGQRIYLDSGGTPDGPVPAIGKVDLAIIGVALPDSRARLPRMLDALQPRYFLPSHQDDFFRPLRRGFQFGPLTDFHEVARIARQSRREMILLDYFRPWTLR